MFVIHEIEFTELQINLKKDFILYTENNRVI